MSKGKTQVMRKGPAGYIALAVVGLITIAPFIYAAVQSVRTTGQISNDPLGIPFPPSLNNYSAVLEGDLYWRPLLNSVVVAALTGVFVLVSATLAAYAISRFRFRGRESVYAFFTIGLLFPAAVAILPLYLMLRQLGLLDTPLGVALPQAAFALPVTVLILRPFFQSIPPELEESAAIDGAGPMRFFVRILLPMAVPALATVTILALVSSWNGYVLPLLLLTSQDQWTLPLGLSYFQGTFIRDTGAILAYTVLSIAPVLLAYAVAERYIVQGLTAGAIKG